MNIDLHQINPCLGKLSQNYEAIKSRYEKASPGTDLVVFPECALTGYPLEDLVLKPTFMEEVHQYINKLVALTQNRKAALLVGTPYQKDGQIFNAAILCGEGKLLKVQTKMHLPNYGVFDEKRHFQTSPHMPEPLVIKGHKLGLMICEDMWFSDVSTHLKQEGAEFLLVINGSPYQIGKRDLRIKTAQTRVKETRLPLVYLNLIGGQDSLVFDGHSFALNADGSIALEAKSFCEDYFMVTLSNNRIICKENVPIAGSDQLSSIYQALTLALKDYVTKNGFSGVVLGMSGGIDSALSAAIAVDALGSDRVHCVMMPTDYTSSDSLDDAKQAADLLGTSYDVLPIQPLKHSFETTLSSKFEGRPPDVTEENIQARIRGLLLMALSNKFGWMLLSTGNKSEVAVGYATLYGDMCGGFNCLKDVYKTDVFKLSQWRNKNSISGFKGPKGPVMPPRIITKPPSAELRPNQKDEDSLPPYDTLDRILKGLIEEDLGPKDLINKGFSKEDVSRVNHLLKISEYKRRQAAPGPKITPRALYGERRYPITNGF